MTVRRRTSALHPSEGPVAGAEATAPDGLERPPDYELSVCEGADGERIDAYLAGVLPDYSRSRLKTLILHRRVRVNRQPVKPGYETRVNDVISVWLDSQPMNSELVPQIMDLELLYEDADVVVVNKPPGLVVHPGAGHREGTLVHGLLAHCSQLASQGGPLRPGIVHRLDRGTSGAMVIAKSDRAYLHLIAQFKARRVEKEYLALVYGSIRESSGEIRASMDRHPGDRTKMAVVTGRGREAVSRWTVERDWGEVSLVRVLLETGRTHQIRVHMSHLQHPIVGDPTYGGGAGKARALQSRPLQQAILRVERPMLHSMSLGFLHPVNQMPLHFHAPLPEDFSRLLDTISCLFR